MLTTTRTLITRVLLAAALTGATVPLAACGESKAAPAVNARNYPESADGLDKLFTDLMAAVKGNDGKRVTQIAESFKLPSPDAWFATTFGDDAGPRLTAEYDGSFVPHFAEGAKEGLADLLAEGRTEIEVTRHDSPSDEGATGYQMTALARMKQPTALYTVRLSRPDGDKGFTLWSFAWVDGQFRMIGKMKTVDPEPLSTELDMLSELSVKRARELLAEH